MKNEQITEGLPIEYWQGQVASLSAIVSEDKSVISELSNTITQKNVEITQKNVEITQKNVEIERLSFQIEEFKRLIFGSKRERFISDKNPLQLAIEFEPKALEIAQAAIEEIKKIKIEYERAKPKKAHVGRLLLPSHLPVVETIIEPLEDTTGMVRIGETVTEELDYTPAKLVNHRIIRPKYMTKEDENGNQKQVIAPLDRPIHKCIASAPLLAQILIYKFIFHLPLYRILLMFDQLGMKIPSSTLESWVKLVANLLRPLYAVHQMHLFKEIYQMVDESPIKVQDSDKQGACHQGYMWVRYAPLSKSVLFEYYKSRSAKGPIDDLNTFTGFVQTDGYSGYTYLAKLQNVTHLSCWAHARRYFEKALKNDKARATIVLEYIQTLYHIEAVAREKQMTHEQRHQYRLDNSLPILNAIGFYIAQERQNVTPKSLIGEAFQYCVNRWSSLQNYLNHGMLEIDSNLVENSIRPLALGRKNYLFAGSHDAAKDIAMHYSFFGTCKKNDIDPLKWLIYVINNIDRTLPEDYKKLLPQYIDRTLVA
jgi:transposase